jgi:hypothetical protein
VYRRLITSASVSVALVIMVAAPAAADGGGIGYTDGPNVGAGASQTSSDGAPEGRRSGSPQQCQYELLSPDDQAMFDRFNREGMWGQPVNADEGNWLRKICDNPDGRSSAEIVWSPQRVSPQQLAQQARDEVPTPSPTVHMNPPADKGEVTNVETWLWIDPSQWQPVTASASAGNVTVTTTATPDHVVWNMGNRDTVTCNGPGKPYDTSRPAREQSTDCGYTYRRSSARESDGRYHVTATVYYQVAWTATGVAAGGALAPITRSSTVAIRVAEIQALNQ